MSRDPFEVSYIPSSLVPHSSSTSAASSTVSVGASVSTTPPGVPSGQSTSMSTTMTQSFKPGTLYAVLLYRQHASYWHWALFLPYETPPPLPHHLHTNSGCTDTLEQEEQLRVSWKGNVWHCTNDNPHGLWTYEQLPPTSLDLPRRLVLAAPLADLSSLGSPPEVASALSDVLASVPVRAEAHKSVFNCRTWMLDGVGELDDGGFLSCLSTMALERELTAAAQLATPKYEEDGSYVMITPRNCSDN